MMKKILAAAIVSAFAAPAFAATANVDVYGQLTVSYDYINTDSSIAGADDKLSRVSSNASRIGFKGAEDLGGGLSAIWQIENQLNMDGSSASPGVDTGVAANTAGGSFSTNLRNTFIGLKSASLGTLLLGKHDTPYKISTGKLDGFSDTLSDYNNIVGTANGANVFDLRTNNTIVYVSPDFSGFSGAAAYVVGNEGGNGTVADFDAWSLMGKYEQGPLFASLAYETHNKFNAAAAVAAVVGPPAVAAVPGVDRDAWKLGLGYTFGNARVGLIYESIDSDVAASATSRDAWYLNGAYKMGNITLKAAYGVADDGESAANTEASSFALGADYALSKRSMVYAQYINVNNKAGGNYGFGANGHGSAYVPATSGAGNDPSAFTIGMRHAF